MTWVFILFQYFRGSRARPETELVAGMVFFNVSPIIRQITLGFVIGRVGA